MQSVDPFGKLEIYIPVEAEVKSIPLWSLPKSVLKGMNLPVSDCDSAKKLKDSPEGILICPAVVRRKGLKPTTCTENNENENMSALLAGEFRTGGGPFQMNFVSANNTAYNVLKGTLPGTRRSAHRPHASPLPHGSAPERYQEAVVIFRGQIYLSSRKSKHQRPPETPEPQLEPPCPTPPTSDSSNSLKKHRPAPASLEPAHKEVKRKRLVVALSKTCTEQPEENHSATPQEPLNVSPKERHTPQRGSDVSSTTATHTVLQPTGLGSTVGGHDGAQAAEEAAGSEIQEDEDAAYRDIAGGESGDVADLAEQSGSHSWTGGESAGASTSLQGEFDFKELAGEEKIARMKAKLRLHEAALSSLNSS